MNWFQQNKFLGAFLIGFALATILALVLLLHEKGAAEDQDARLETTMAELNRLRGSVPFPNESNLKKTRTQVESYRVSLGALEEKLKAQTLPLAPLQPNEFQAQLRAAVNGVLARAAEGKVQLPANFFLGFDEYATSLPNQVAAPLLGQELKAIELLLNDVIDARVDSLALIRTSLPEEKANPSPTPTKTRSVRAISAASALPAPVAMHSIEVGFSASPTAARKVLNQVATAKQQLFIIRALEVKNQVDKGPKREAAPAPAIPSPAGGRPTTAPVVAFIVGAEHLDVTVKIDIVNLVSPASQKP